MNRTSAFGQSYTPTIVDRFGVWLSSRSIKKHVRSFTDIQIADIGCGYHATFIRSLNYCFKQAYLIDVALADDLKKNPKIIGYEGNLLEELRKIPSASVHVVLCISVLEHLWDPQLALNEFYRILVPTGIALINVPNWLGKAALEFSAFKLKFSPKLEMDDHKMYYNKKDLWPLLIKAGFKPSNLNLRYHKLCLNTFAVCKKN